MPERLSGQQKSQENLADFLTWAASKTDAQFKEMVRRGQLCQRGNFQGIRGRQAGTDKESTRSGCAEAT